MIARRRLRSGLKRAALGGLLLSACCALLEHALEAREKSLATADSTFCPINGRSVRYLLSGAEQVGPTIVLIPGLMGSLEQWDDVQAQLSRHAKVLSYDRGGTGFSDSSDAHNAASQADELFGLLQARRLAGDCIVVGYSSSAFVARVFAGRYPELAKGLVLIDPATRHDHSAFPPYRVISYRRDLLRSIVSGSVKALIGSARLVQSLKLRGVPPATPADAKGRYLVVSFHHWFAAGQDAMALDTSSAQAEAATIPAIPIGVLSTYSPVHNPNSFAEQKELARGQRAIFRSSLHPNHSALLSHGTNQETVALIEAIAQQARGAASAP